MKIYTVISRNVCPTLPVLAILVLGLVGLAFSQSVVADHGLMSAGGRRDKPNPISGGLLVLNTDSLFFGEANLGVPKNDTIFVTADFDSVHVDSVIASDTEITVAPTSAYVSAAPADTVPLVVTLRATLSGAHTTQISIYWSYRSFGEWVSSTTQAECYATDTAEASLDVLLASAAATFENGQVNIDFRTSSEVAVAGFRISRSVSESGPFSLIADYLSNPILVARGQANSGADYSYVDSKGLTTGTYYYKIEEVDQDGTSRQLGSLIKVNVQAPNSYALYQNYPNPFNPSTTIPFDLKSTSDVDLSVYNILGQKVIDKDYGTLPAGHFQENVNFGSFSSGVYFYRLNIIGSDGQHFMSLKKLQLLK